MAFTRSLTTRFASLLLPLCLIACGGTAPSAATPSPSAAAASPAAPAGLPLHLGEVLVYVDDHEVFKLHADGTTEAKQQMGDQAEWVAGPTFATDGRVSVDGEEKAHLTDKGYAERAQWTIDQIAAGATTPPSGDG